MGEVERIDATKKYRSNNCGQNIHIYIYRNIYIILFIFAWKTFGLKFDRAMGDLVQGLGSSRAKIMTIDAMKLAALSPEDCTCRPETKLLQENGDVLKHCYIVQDREMMSSTSKYNYSACGPRNTLLPIGSIPTLEMILNMFISVKQSQFLPFCSMPIDKPRTKKHNSRFSNVLVLTCLFVGRYSARFLLGLQTHQLQLDCWNQILG